MPGLSSLEKTQVKTLQKTAWRLTQEIRTNVCTQTCIPVFMAARLLIAPTWTQPTTSICWSRNKQVRVMPTTDAIRREKGTSRKYTCQHGGSLTHRLKDARRKRLHAHDPVEMPFWKRQKGRDREAVGGGRGLGGRRRLIATGAGALWGSQLCSVSRIRDMRQSKLIERDTEEKQSSCA